MGMLVHCHMCIACCTRCRVKDISICSEKGYILTLSLASSLAARGPPARNLSHFLSTRFCACTQTQTGYWMHLAPHRQAGGKRTRQHLIWLELVNIKANWVLWTASLLHVWLVQVAARPSPTSVNLQTHKRASLMKRGWSVAYDLTTETIISHQLLVLVYSETVTPHSG